MVKSTDIRAMRSALYMPGTNLRAMEKAKSLPVDCLILDVEDAVLPERKAEARTQIVEMIAKGGFGKRRLLARINPFGSDDLADDLDILSDSGLHGFVLPKVTEPGHVKAVVDSIESKRGRQDFEVWCMIENAKGVQNVDQIAGSVPQMAGLLLGPADLAKDLGLQRSDMDSGMSYALSRILIAARAEGLFVLDGPFMDVKDLEGLQRQAAHRKSLGYDGKTLIHPAGLETVNAVFGPSEQEIQGAQKIIHAFEQAKEKGEGVTLLDGHMIEALHVEEAQDLLARAQWIRDLN